MKQKTIGILGGGQLARMSAFAAIRMGFDVAVLEKIADSPAGVLTRKEFVGWVDDEEILKKFTDASDVITLENEFIDSSYLRKIEDWGKTVIPSSKTISLIQDKFIQKSVLQDYGIPVPKFINIEPDMDYKFVKNSLGKRFVLKSRKMGYDGYGNRKVTNESSFKEGIDQLRERHSELYAEEFVKFKKELAVMILRSSSQTKIYPVVETIQKDHICHTVIAPVSISKKLKIKIEAIAGNVLDAIDGNGIFGIEFFLTKGEVLVNEVAPRPHNSGHYTIDACKISQFENHIRSVLELPLGSTEMIQQNAVMINLLGKKEGEGLIEDYNTALGDKDIHLHIYGKKKSRPGRKMGHITLTGSNQKELLERVKNIEKQIMI